MKEQACQRQQHISIVSLDNCDGEQKLFYLSLYKLLMPSVL